MTIEKKASLICAGFLAVLFIVGILNREDRSPKNTEKNEQARTSSRLFDANGNLRQIKGQANHDINAPSIKPRPWDPLDAADSPKLEPEPQSEPQPKPHSKGENGPSSKPLPLPEPSLGTATVRSGESMWDIAKRRLGNPKLYWRIVAANPQVNPRKLRPGMQLNLPDLSRVKPAPLKPIVPTGNRRHLVKRGETLSRISQHYYNSARRWNDIARANSSKVVGPKYTIREGLELVIP